jgi:hypothetical protein
MGKARWKVVSPKKLSSRKRRSGLEFSKAGFCVFTNDVVCSYRKSVKVRMMDRCFECSELARFERKMEEEEEKFFNEVDEVRRRFPT